MAEIQTEQVPCTGCPYLRENEAGDIVVYGCIRLPYQECQIEAVNKRED